MDKDTMFMREALKEAAAASSEGEVPIGAVVVCGDAIIGRGHNMTERLHDATAHAEMIAITSATESLGGKYLQKCTLYVTVEPCPMCAAALCWSQVDRVVYGAPDPKRGYSLFSAEPEAPGLVRRTLMHPRTEVVSGVLEEECGKLMVDFFKTKR
ncbi:MAG: nucleoside deaminase [Bacteroidales bacterium]|nr:nucleoside deaminase [Bacteroidales bacterium]